MRPSDGQNGLQVDSLTDEQLRDAVMRLRGITDPAAFDPAMVGEVMALVKNVELINTLPGQPSKASARIPGGVHGINGWITEHDPCPLRAMMRAYLKAMNWPNC